MKRHLFVSLALASSFLFWQSVRAQSPELPNDDRNVIAGEPLGHAPWLQNLLGNITLRKLQVEHIAPIHGEYVPYSQFLESVITMTQFLPRKASTN